MANDDLPPHVAKFIDSLGEGDIATLGRVIATFRMMESWCRVTRWLFLAAIGLVVLASQFMDSAKKLLSFR